MAIELTSNPICGKRNSGWLKVCEIMRYTDEIVEAINRATAGRNALLLVESFKVPLICS